MNCPKAIMFCCVSAYTCCRRRHFQLKLKNEELVTSTLAAKVNAYLAGYHDFGCLEKLAKEYGMSDSLRRRIEDIARRGGDPRACH